MEFLNEMEINLQIGNPRWNWAPPRPTADLKTLSLMCAGRSRTPDSDQLMNRLVWAEQVPVSRQLFHHRCSLRLLKLLIS